MMGSEGPGKGTQIGRECAAGASKPIPIFKGHFGRKGYPLLWTFLEMEANFSQFSNIGNFWKF